MENMNHKLVMDDLPNLVLQAVETAKAIKLGQNDITSLENVVTVRVFFLIVEGKCVGDFKNLLGEIRHLGINFLSSSKVAIPVLAASMKDGVLKLESKDHVSSVGTKSLEVAEGTR